MLTGPVLPRSPTPGVSMPQWVNQNPSFNWTEPFMKDVIKRRPFPRYWPFVREIHRSLVNSPHKGQWRRALMFSLICAWINSWVNNREAVDLRRHHAHYDVIVIGLDTIQNGWWEFAILRGAWKNLYSATSNSTRLHTNDSIDTVIITRFQSYVRDIWTIICGYHG